LLSRLKNIKQKVNFSRDKIATDEHINTDNDKQNNLIEKGEHKTKTISFKKGRDFFEDLKSYYQLNKEKLINNIQNKKSSLKSIKSTQLSAEELKSKLEINKKKWKRNTKKFNIFLFFFSSSYVLYMKYNKRFFLTYRISPLVFGIGVLSILSNVFMQTKINDYYKFKIKEIIKD
jgi:hypothetical protein